MTIRFGEYKKRDISFLLNFVANLFLSEINSILFSKAEDFYGKRELLRGFLRENRI